MQPFTQRFKTYHDVTCECSDCLIGYPHHECISVVLTTEPLPVPVNEEAGQHGQRLKVETWALTQNTLFTSRRCSEATGVVKTTVNKTLRDLVDDFQLRIVDYIVVGTTSAPRYLRESLTPEEE